MPEAVAAAAICVCDARTDKGGRADNQDAVRVAPHDHPGIAERGWLMVLCDGVGGEAGGQLASTAATEAAFNAYYDTPHGDTPRDWLDAAVKRAHLAVLREATTNSLLRRMSTTLVAAAVLDGKATIAHVGDSRAYLARGAQAELTQLTHDHKNDATNTVTRSLGAGANHDAEFLAEPMTLLPGDRLILCSDGVSGVLDEAVMSGILSRKATPADAATALLAAAMEHHTDDNITAAVLDFGERPVARVDAPTTRQRWLWMFIPIGLVLIALALFAVRSTKVTPPIATPNVTTRIGGASNSDTGEPGGFDWSATESAPTSLPTVAPILEQTSAAATQVALDQIATKIAAAKTRVARPTATPRSTATIAPQPTPTPQTGGTATATSVVPTPQPSAASPPATAAPAAPTQAPPPDQPAPVPANTSAPDSPGSPRNPPSP